MKIKQTQLPHIYASNAIISVHTRGGILAENKFQILHDLFWIHFGRASILAKFWIICINFQIRISDPETSYDCNESEITEH